MTKSLSFHHNLSQNEKHIKCGNWTFYEKNFQQKEISLKYEICLIMGVVNQLKRR
jgi:hypothetical protein